MLENGVTIQKCFSKTLFVLCIWKHMAMHLESCSSCTKSIEAQLYQ